MHCCQKMDSFLVGEDRVVVYVDHFREYGVPVNDGGCSHIVIEHCPWCGAKLPGSLRDEWFDILDHMGLEADDARIPEDMKSDAWWQSKYGTTRAP